jgi:hypothetical protein
MARLVGSADASVEHGVPLCNPQCSADSFEDGGAVSAELDLLWMKFWPMGW